MEDKDRVQPPGDIKNDAMEGHAENGDSLDAAYAFPNDDLVQSAEDERHAMYVMLCEDRLHLAPVFAALSKPGAKVLDLGMCTINHGCNSTYQIDLFWFSIRNWYRTLGS